MIVLPTLQYLLARLAGRDPDASADWAPEHADESDLADELDGIPGGPASALECLADRVCADVTEIDLRSEAASVTYRSGSYRGKLKRTLFPLRDLRKLRVVLMVHQTGFEAPSRSSVWRKVTAHDVVKPDATLCRLHDPAVRLVAGNRIDRAPWGGVHLEVGGNLERIDGDGSWWSPETAGRGRASDGQIAAARRWVVRTVGELGAFGIVVEGIAPHVVTGRDSRGRPNRGACPGSRLHAEVVEWAGAELELAVPGPGFALGGSPVDPAWHGEHWSRCRRFLAA